MKDGTTHLAYKPEHAVDMDTGAVVAAELHPAADIPCFAHQGAHPFGGAFRKRTTITRHHNLPLENRGRSVSCIH